MTRAEQHTCHAMECEAHVPPRMFMCRRHWYMVPRALRDAVWAAYQPGQEDFAVMPTDEYFAVTERAIRFVAVREGLLSASSQGSSHALVPPSGETAE